MVTAQLVRALTSSLVLCAAIFIGVDSSRLGAKKGVLGGGFLDMGAVGWFFATFFLSVIAVPCYLVTRPKLVATRARRQAATTNAAWPVSSRGGPRPSWSPPIPTSGGPSTGWSGPDHPGTPSPQWAAAPRWATDPWGEHRWRWWDGANWTSQTSD